jgi:hypothetical protein
LTLPEPVSMTLPAASLRHDRHVVGLADRQAGRIHVHAPLPVSMRISIEGWAEERR